MSDQKHEFLGIDIGSPAEMEAAGKEWREKMGIIPAFDPRRTEIIVLQGVDGPYCIREVKDD